MAVVLRHVHTQLDHRFLHPGHAFAATRKATSATEAQDSPFNRVHLRLLVLSPRQSLLQSVLIYSSVIVVSIGRLVSIAKAGSGLESDITCKRLTRPPRLTLVNLSKGSTINYIQWVQCEAPISVLSVSLPNCFQLAKRMHEQGVWVTLTGRSSSKSMLPSFSIRTKPSRQEFVRLQRLDSTLQDDDTNHLNTRATAFPVIRDVQQDSIDAYDDALGLEADPHNVHIRRDVDVHASDQN